MPAEKYRSVVFTRPDFFLLHGLPNLVAVRDGVILTHPGKPDFWFAMTIATAKIWTVKNLDEMTRSPPINPIENTKALMRTESWRVIAQEDMVAGVVRDPSHAATFKHRGYANGDLWLNPHCQAIAFCPGDLCLTRKGNISPCPRPKFEAGAPPSWYWSDDSYPYWSAGVPPSPRPSLSPTTPTPPPPLNGTEQPRPTVWSKENSPLPVCATDDSERLEQG